MAGGEKGWAERDVAAVRAQDGVDRGISASQNARQAEYLQPLRPLAPLDLCLPPTMRRFRTFILKCLQDCVHDNTPLAASPAERATTVLSEHLASGSSRARWVSNRW